LDVEKIRVPHAEIKTAGVIIALSRVRPESVGGIRLDKIAVSGACS
jgi:hypothetical protein